MTNKGNQPNEYDSASLRSLMAVPSLQNLSPPGASVSARAPASVSQASHVGAPNIHAMAGRGDTEAVLAIIQEYGFAAVSSRDSEGRTALHFAAISGSEALVAMVLEAGVAVDVCDNHAKTPLHWAVAAGDASIASRLLDAGADVNLQFYSGETALHVAVFLEQRDTTGELLSFKK
jgi:ankyrin repeat protein